jgi:hypothetical protein
MVWAIHVWQLVWNLCDQTWLVDEINVIGCWCTWLMCMVGTGYGTWLIFGIVDALFMVCGWWYRLRYRFGAWLMHLLWYMVYGTGWGIGWCMVHVGTWLRHINCDGMWWSWYMLGRGMCWFCWAYDLRYSLGDIGMSCMRIRLDLVSWMR